MFLFVMFVAKRWSMVGSQSLVIMLSGKKGPAEGPLYFCVKMKQFDLLLSGCGLSISLPQVTHKFVNKFFTLGVFY
jgi:hypothetical protein